MIRRMVIMLALVGLVLGGFFWFQGFKATMIKKFMAAAASPPQTVAHELLMAELDLVGVRRIFPGIVHDLVREGGREEENLNGFREHPSLRQYTLSRSTVSSPETYPLTRMPWSPMPCWSSMLSASSITRTFNWDTSN